MIGMFINFHMNILFLKLKTFLLFNCKIAKLEVHFFFLYKKQVLFWFCSTKLSVYIRGASQPDDKHLNFRFVGKLKSLLWTFDNVRF